MNNYSGYVSLHNHTEIGSLLDSINRVPDLFKRAKEINHNALAITEHGTMSSHYDCWKESKKTGVKLLVGEEFYFTDDMSSKKNYHLVLIAKNHNGYKNILRLNYESFKNPSIGYMGKATPRITWEHLEKYHDDIFCLTACSNGLIAKTLITEQDEKLGDCYIDRLHGLFQDRFFLEMQPHSLYALNKDGKEVNQIKLNNMMLRKSYEKGIPYVITCDSHYSNQEQAKYHDQLLAIKDHKAFDDPERFRYGVQDMYLKSTDEIINFFGTDIAFEGMRNTVKIADACEEASYLEAHGPILPKFPVQDEDDYDSFIDWKKDNASTLDEDKAYLRYLCTENFKAKTADFPLEKKKEYWERLKTETAILEDKDFSSYMLIVADYINWAKKNMPTGPGRGSVAGSLTAYLLGISQIDPIKYDLLFERFHNKQKTSYPDIDADFAEPDKVKDYLKNKYGEDKVASISNWSGLTPKVLVKDIARSLELGGSKSSAFKIANFITSVMPDADTIEEALETDTFKDYMDKYPEILDTAKNLQNLTRNFSVHAAGVVISDKPLYEITPLRIEHKTGITATQWEKKRCEDNGLIKMDLLGLETLNVIAETVRLIKEQHNVNVNIDSIPLDDKEVYKMIGKGDVAGVFQLEASLAPLCQKIKPKNIEGISAINALGRPSCQPSVRKSYINRVLGEEDVTYEHPNLERALKKTYGIMLYEESAMFIAQDVAGWDLNDADNLRKITKLKGSNPKLVLDTKAKFIKDSMKFSNINYEFADYLWESYLAPLGAYGFNKSHSIAYSHISYQTAWLRCHYPTEFMCALLNSQDPNSDKVQDYIQECSKMKIKIMPPNILKSGSKYTIIAPSTISTGLAAVKGVGETALESIINSRPYYDLQTFFAKIDNRVVNKRVIQALAKAGAFDALDASRKDIHDNYDSFRKKIAKELEKLDENVDGYWENISNINIGENKSDNWTRKELLLAEKESLGRTISGGLHEIFPGFFKEQSESVFYLNQMSTTKKGTRVKIEVIVNNFLKEYIIKNGPNAGDKFGKYSIEDVYGNISELTLWAKEYEKYKNILIPGTPIKAICTVSEYMDNKSLSLVGIERKI